MALLWAHDDGENLYEVRSAGASIRLYRNGVNHSQWNPNRPLAGSVWDLLTLPALHRQRGAIQDGLMLGFGAGAAGRQLRDLAHLRSLVGVELDPMHLSIADGFFDCTDGCELVAGDAVEWVDSQSAQSYDYIVDDLYAEEDGVPERFAPLDRDWCERLADLLRPGGILVLNMIDPERVPLLPLFREPGLRARLPHRIGYQLEGYENRVLAFSEQPFEPDSLAANLREISRRFPASRGVSSRYLSFSI